MMVVVLAKFGKMGRYSKRANSHCRLLRVVLQQLREDIGQHGRDIYRDKGRGGKR